MKNADKEGNVVLDTQPQKERLIEPGRKTISFHVSTDEKARIIKTAVDDYGLTVSEYIRHKLLTDDKTAKAQIEETNTDDAPSKDEMIDGLFDDMEAMSTKLRDKDTLIAELKSVIENPDKSLLSINFNDEQKVMLAQIQNYRKANGVEPIDLTAILIKGLLEFANDEYWSNNFSNNNGVRLSEFEGALTIME